MGPKSALPVLQLILALLAPGHSLPLSLPPLPRPLAPSSLFSSPFSSVASSASSPLFPASSSSSSSLSSTPTLIFHNGFILSRSRGGDAVTLSTSSSLSPSSTTSSRGGGTLTLQLGHLGVLEAVAPGPWKGGIVAEWHNDGARPALPTLRQENSRRRARHPAHPLFPAAGDGTSQEKFLQVLHLLLLRSGSRVSTASAPQLEGSSGETRLSKGPPRYPEGRVKLREQRVGILPQDLSPLTAGFPARDLEPVACCQGHRNSPLAPSRETAAVKPKSGHLVRASVITKAPPDQNTTQTIQDEKRHVSQEERKQKTKTTRAATRNSSQDVSRLSSKSLSTKDFEPESGMHTDRHLKLKTNFFSTNFKVTGRAAPALAPVFHPKGRPELASSEAWGHQRSTKGVPEGTTPRAANASWGVLGGDERNKGTERRRRSPFFLDNRIRPWVTAEVKLDLSYSHVAHCDYADRHYCLNGGTCVFVGALDIKTCRCPVGFTGLRCEEMDQAFLIALLTNSIYGYE